MLKISILDTSSHRRLVIEGKLVAPWAALLRSVWQKATADLNGRVVEIDLEGLTAITEEGEDILLELMQEGASFRPSGVFTKQGLELIAYMIRGNVQETKT